MSRVALLMLCLLAGSGCRQVIAPSITDPDLTITGSDSGAADALHSRRGAIPKRAARFEIQFLKNMIDHHTMATEITALCPGRTVHAELLQLCEDMREAQQHEIAMMQQLLTEWYGITHEPMMTRSEQRVVERLARLHGAKFETAFMKTMIPHHAEAIDMAKEAVRRSYHRELVEMAREMIQAQSAEIRKMKRWLCSWYGLCRRGDRDDDD